MVGVMLCTLCAVNVQHTIRLDGKALYMDIRGGHALTLLNSGVVRNSPLWVLSPWRECVDDTNASGPRLAMDS